MRGKIVVYTLNFEKTSSVPVFIDFSGSSVQG